MSVEKHHGHFRARLTKDQKTWRGPTRGTEAEAQADLLELKDARDKSAAELEAAITRLTDRERPSSSTDPGSVQSVGNSFRARLKLGQATHQGPLRSSRGVAEADLHKLRANRSLSVEAFRAFCAGLGLEKRHETVKSSLRSCLQFWVDEDSTEKPLPRQLARFAEQPQHLDLVAAGRMLVEDYWHVKKVSQRPGVEWLQGRDVAWLLERGSRPLRTSGLQGAGVYPGLVNLGGQSCYLNSVVQCLRSCKPLQEHVLGQLNAGPLGTSCRTLLERLQSGQWDWVTPAELLSNLFLHDPASFQFGMSAAADECCIVLLQSCVGQRELFEEPPERRGTAVLYFTFEFSFRFL